MLNKDGHEVPDQTPLTLPSGFKRPETLAEQVQRLVRTHVSREAAAAGAETFDESEDFDVGDDIDPSSPYEAQFDPILGRDITAEEMRVNSAQYKARYMQSQAEYFASLERDRVLNEGPLEPELPMKEAPKPDGSKEKPVHST